MTHHPTPSTFRTIFRSLGLSLAIAVMVILSACGGSATATPIAATATTAAGVASTQAPTSAPTTAGGSTAATGSSAAATVPAGSAATTSFQKVNANTASQAELLAAFQANGIPNAARWVQEVMEYRPYPTNDPTFAKLRTELAKYNPSPDVVDKIVASLSL